MSHFAVSPMVPECGPCCAGSLCREQPPEQFLHSRWRDFEGHARRRALPTLEAFRASTERGGEGGVNGAIGRGLDELQLHVAAEVKRLQMLLTSGRLAAPHGDEAPMAEDYLPHGQAFDPPKLTTGGLVTAIPASPKAQRVADEFCLDCHPAEQRAEKFCLDCHPAEQVPVLPMERLSQGEVTSEAESNVSVFKVQGVPVKNAPFQSECPTVNEFQVNGADMGPCVTGWMSGLSEKQAHAAAMRQKEYEMQEALGLRPEEARSEKFSFRGPTRFQKQMRRLVNNTCFELFWITAVIINAALIGVQTQYAATHIGEDEPLILRGIQHFFAFLFVVELLMRCSAAGCREFFLGIHKVWAWIDLVIVVVSLLEFFLDVAVMLATKDEPGSKGSNNLRTVRMIRLARFLRGFRIERLLHLVSGLRTLVFSIANTLKSLLWALLLLFIIIYMVGIMLTQAVVDYLADGDPEGLVAMGINNYWRSLDVTMFTLFQSITGGLSWHEAMLTLGKVSMVLVMIFTAYVAFTCFAVMNVVTGVFCNTAIESASRNPDMVAQKLMLNRKAYVGNLEKLFALVDQDENDMITFSELEEVVNDTKNRAYLAALEIEAADAWTLFKLIDTDRDGVIKREEFIKGCLQLKGVARQFEILNLGHEVDRFERKLARFMGKVDECRDLLRRSAGVSSNAPTPAYMPTSPQITAAS